MENKESIKLFFRNLIIYAAIFIGSFILYNSNNTSPQNSPHTDFSFVYAQF